MRTIGHLFVVAVALVAGAIPDALATSNPQGPTGKTNRDGPGGVGSGCASCHGSVVNAGVSVAITGPATLTPGQLGTYTVTATRAIINGSKMGVNVASSDSGTPLSVVAGEPMIAAGTAELVHTFGGIKTTLGNTASYLFNYTMPAGAVVGTTHTLYAVSQVGPFGAGGGYNHAPNFPVTTAPFAPSSLAAGTITSSSVFFTWSGSGPAYRIVYKAGLVAPANQSDGTVVDLGNVTSTTVTGLAAGTQYTFRIFSRNAGNTVFSAGNSVTATTLPNAPVITSSLATINGTVNSPVTSYTIVAAGATSFGASNLPPGVTRVGAVISGTPTSGGTFDVQISATNTGGSDFQIKQYVIARLSQSITFGAPPSPAFVAGGTFNVSASAIPSGLGVTYASNTPSICSVFNPSVGTVTMNSTGSCIVRADQAGSGVYNPASNTQTVVIAANMPGAPTIGAVTPGNSTLSIAFSPPSNDGGATITGYIATCTPSGTGNSTSSPIVVSSLTNDIPYTCSVAATNSAGTGASSGTVTATPRADPDGQLDPTFGTAGISEFAAPSGNIDSAFGMAVQPDGKILVAGSINVGGNQNFKVARYQANGKIDSTFGTGGVSTTDFGSSSDFALAVALQSNGRIVLAGVTNSSGSGNDIALARFLPDGGLDGTFGTNGQVVTVHAGNDFAYSIAIDSKDRILLAAQYDDKGLPSFSVLRYSEDGKLDEVFGNAGVATVPVGAGGGTATAVAIDSEGKIVASGISNTGSFNDVAVARFLPDGTPDSSFGTGGVVITDFGGDDNAFGLTLAKDRPVIAGARFIAGTTDFLIARYFGDGTLEYSTTADVSGNRPDNGRAVVLQPDGKFVVAGLISNLSTGTDFALMRFSNAGVVDPTFGTNGRTVTAITPQADSPGIGSAALQYEGTIVVAGTSNNRFVVARYLLDAPAAFSFNSPGNVGTSLLVQSNVVAITNISIAVYVEVTNGQWSLNCDPAGFTTARGSVSAGQSVCVRHTTSPIVGGTVTTTLVVGGQTAAFTSTATQLTTLTVSRAGAGSGTVTSVPSGISCGLDCAEAFAPGASVTLTATPAADSFLAGWSAAGCPGTGTCGVIAAAGLNVVATFQLKTAQAITFNPISNRSLSASPFTVSATGGGSGNAVVFTSSTPTVCTAGGTNGTSITLLTVGACTITANQAGNATFLAAPPVPQTFQVLAASDTTPNAFTFVDQVGVARSAVITSNAITVAGIDAASPISVAGGSYSIGCTAAFVTTAATITNGQTVCVRHTSSANFSSATNTTLTIGGVSDIFTSSTAAADTTPNAFSFTDQANVQPGAVVTSNTITISGIDAPATVAIAGGSYSIGCGAVFTSQAGPITNGQTICVVHTSPIALGATTNTLVTIGGVSDTFSSTTIATLPPGDTDGDGIPNGVEGPEGRNPLAKDNDIFTSNRLFAMQQYRDFLGREGDAGGITGWVNFLNSGGTRAAVTEGFFGSPEFQGTGSPVVRLYFAYFLRIPDYSGLTFWMNYFRTGHSLIEISNAFAGSQEFVDRYGALSNSAFVDLVYQNVLGRAPDAGGKAFWLGQLNAGTSRGEMMTGFSESAEYQSTIFSETYVTMMYVGMLKREPDAGGFTFWVNYIDQGNSGQALIGGFLVAPEYHNRFLP